MLTSYDKQFLFIHVPRTGGTSISTALTAFANDPASYPVNGMLARLGIRVNHWLCDYRHIQFRVHTSARNVKRRLPEQVWNDFFKFAFVRNPWDLLVSYHRYVLARPEHKRHKRFCRMEFSDYLRFMVTRRLGHQAEFLSDKHGVILVDFVGRFERLSRDFNTVLERLSVAAELPHLNRTQRADFHEYYTPVTRDYVQHHYRKDIELFGYQF